MITLESIKTFAIDENACKRSLLPFCNFLKEGNKVECWRIVLANINWLDAHGLNLKLYHKAVCKKAEYVSKMYFIDDPTRCSKLINFDKQGRIHGEVIEYYFDGTVNSISNYKRGNTISSISYYNNGKVAATKQFKHNRYHGKMCFYHVNGNLRDYLNYDNGALHGKCESFYEDGTLKSKCKYFKNNYHDEMAEYDNDGKIKWKKIYDHGIQLKYFRYENGKIVERLIFKYDNTNDNISAYVG